MASSGSPLADKACKRLSASKNPSCPIVASANQNLTHQIRTAREKQLFFEVPFSLLIQAFALPRLVETSNPLGEWGVLVGGGMIALIVNGLWRGTSKTLLFLCCISG